MPRSQLAQALFDITPAPVDGAAPDEASVCSHCGEVPANVRWRLYDGLGILSGWVGYEALCAAHGTPVARMVLAQS